MADARTLGFPVTSKATSTIRPPVASANWATAPSAVAAMTSVAPCADAKERRRAIGVNREHPPRTTKNGEPKR